MAKKAEYDIQEEIDEAVDSVGTQIANVETSLGAVEDSVASGATWASGASVDASKAVQSLGDVETSIGDIETSLGDVETSVASALSSADSVGVQAGNIEASVGDVETSLGDVETSVASALSSADSVGGQVGDVETSLGDVETSVASALSSADSVGVGVSSVDDKCDSLGSQLDLVADPFKTTKFSEVSSGAVSLASEAFEKIYEIGADENVEIKAVTISLATTASGATSYGYRITQDDTKIFPFGDSDAFINGEEMILEHTVQIEKGETWAVEVYQSAGSEDAAGAMESLKLVKHI